MHYLLDNVISELRTIFSSVFRRLANRGAASNGFAAIQGTWVDRIANRFRNHVLAIDRAVAERRGCPRVSVTMPDVDGLVTATALVRGPTAIMCNVGHVAPAGAPHINPFNDAG